MPVKFQQLFIFCITVLKKKKISGSDMVSRVTLLSNVYGIF